MNDFDSRLRDRMRHRAATTAVSGGSLADVLARGRQRRRRARIATSTALAVAVIGGVLGSVAWLDRRSGDGADVAISAGTSADASGSASGTSPAVEVDPLDFRPVDAVDRLANVRSVATADGVVYALSTAPGATDSFDGESYIAAPQAVYRAQDGGGWEAVPLSDDLRLHGLAASANRLYGVGTAPAASASEGDADGDRSDAVVAWSDDGGTTWSTSVLPIRPEGLDPSVNAWVGDSSVAVGDAGIVAVLTTWADVDLSGRLPDGTNLDYGYETGPDGVAVYGPPDEVSEDMRVELEAMLCEAEWTFDTEQLACVSPDGSTSNTFAPEEVFSVLGATGEPVARYSWEELGLSPEVGRLVSGVPQVFHSSDGETFQPVTDSLTEAGTGIGGLDVIATDDGFLAAAQVYEPSEQAGFADEEPTTALWRSADGVTWAPVESPTAPEVEWAMTTGRVGDRLALVGHARSGPVVSTTVDGTSWTSTDPSDLLSTDSAAQVNLQHAAVGDGGIAVTLREYVDPIAASGGVEVPAGEYTLRILDSNGRAVLVDGSGAEVVALESVFGAVSEVGIRRGYEAAAGGDPTPSNLAPSTTALAGAAPTSAAPATTASATTAPADAATTVPASPETLVAAETAADAVITDPATGEELVTVPYEAIWSTMEEASSAAGGGAGRAWVAWSPDGVSWSMTDITDQLELPGGAEAGVRGVYVGASTLTVELGEAQPVVDDDGQPVPGPSRTLVASIPA